MISVLIFSTGPILWHHWKPGKCKISVYSVRIEHWWRKHRKKHSICSWNCHKTFPRALGKRTNSRSIVDHVLLLVSCRKWKSIRRSAMPINPTKTPFVPATNSKLVNQHSSSIQFLRRWIRWICMFSWTPCWTKDRWWNGFTWLDWTKLILDSCSLMNWTFKLLTTSWTFVIRRSSGWMIWKRILNTTNGPIAITISCETISSVVCEPSVRIFTIWWWSSTHPRLRYRMI